MPRPIAAIFKDLDRSLPKATPASRARLAKAPIAVRPLYAWRDGAPDFVLTDDGSSDWLPLSDALRERAQLRKVRKDFAATWFPLFADGAGNFVCLDEKTGALVDFDHEQTKHRRIAVSLAAFLERQVQERKKLVAEEPPQGVSETILEHLRHAMVRVRPVVAAREEGRTWRRRGAALCQEAAGPSRLRETRRRSAQAGRPLGDAHMNARAN